MTRTRLMALVIAAAQLGLPAAAQLPPGGTFTDDDGNLHEPNIEAIAAEGITLGCNPPFGDRFCPWGFLTRGEMAAFLTRALNLPASTEDFFGDDDGSLFESDINALAAAGIITGCSPDLYCPDRTVRRSEMAVFLSRALGSSAVTQDFFGDDDGLAFEDEVNAIAAEGITIGCDVDRYCPFRPVRRDEMASFLTRGLDLTPMTPPDRPPLGWSLVVGGLNRPIQTLVPPGETRMLIAELGGLIRVFDNGTLRTSPFLDLRGVVETGGEKGLLSMAIHPDYPDDRRLFVWYYGRDDHTHLVEYDVAADGNSAFSPRTVLSIAQPFGNHNGGFIDFGSDGYLYLSTGDGGSGNDPGGRARDLSTLLGKMLRVDVDGALPYAIPPDNPYVGKTGRNEIWASGLRNPWRWSFDDGFLYIGDVGESSREEIDLVATEPVGYDFGWSRFEGSLCNPSDPDPSCVKTGLTFPVAEYGRAVGRAVTGGVVYRGPTVRSLQAYYLYADFATGMVRGFRQVNGIPVESKDFTGRLGGSGIVSFGTDWNGELVVANLFDGAIYRLVGG
ncbi:MAG TPA: PQQ-dependent sugar dehydrogenase [Acidimicrobiia bacterium]|nr:PQQ-dependent sugar dehydrogenase [Acidimicrobiia bacterium]